MTAAGLYLRFRLGQQPKDVAAIDQGLALLAALPPQSKARRNIDHYYWFYGAHAAFFRGGKVWDTWSKALATALVGRQRQDGNFKGSWDPEGVWGEDGGRVGTTALALLTLQAEYRYAPARTKKEPSKKGATPKRKKPD